MIAIQVSLTGDESVAARRAAGKNKGPLRGSPAPSGTRRRSGQARCEERTHGRRPFVMHPTHGCCAAFFQRSCGFAGVIPV